MKTLHCHERTVVVIATCDINASGRFFKSMGASVPTAGVLRAQLVQQMIDDDIMGTKLATVDATTATSGAQIMEE